jgi:hypothetical protein
MASIIPSNRPEKPATEGRISGQQVDILLDSGATVSLISEECWERVKPEKVKRVTTSKDINIWGIDQGKLDWTELVEVELEIAEGKITRPLFVVRGVGRCLWYEASNQYRSC